DQHVRLLSSEPFGWFAPPKSTRAWEPTLLWNHYTHCTGPWFPSFAKDAKDGAPSSDEVVVEGKVNVEGGG
ncbi:MAG: hypothetical protein WA539_03535, partial [Candidatus Sulfotelmatobacter sp.]